MSCLSQTRSASCFSTPLEMLIGRESPKHSRLIGPSSGSSGSPSRFVNHGQRGPSLPELVRRIQGTRKRNPEPRQTPRSNRRVRGNRRIRHCLHAKSGEHPRLPQCSEGQGSQDQRSQKHRLVCSSVRTQARRKTATGTIVNLSFPSVAVSHSCPFVDALPLRNQ